MYFSILNNKKKTEIKQVDFSSTFSAPLNCAFLGRLCTAVKSRNRRA